MQGIECMIRRLESQLNRIEMLRLDEHFAYVRNWRRRLLYGFLSGIVRGVGFSIGFTFLSALILFLLKDAAVANLPIVGRFLAELVRIVEANLK